MFEKVRNLILTDFTLISVGLFELLESRALPPCSSSLFVSWTYYDKWNAKMNHTWRTFPVIHVIFGVKTSWAEGGSSRGGRPLRLCFGGGGSSASPSLRTVSTPGVAAPGLWPLFPRSFCVESLRQLTSARPLICKSSAVFSRDDNLVWNIDASRF